MRRLSLLAMAAGALALGCQEPVGSDGDALRNEPDFKTQSVRANKHRTIVEGTGNLTEALSTFRSLLGVPLNNTPGTQPSGRREVNWDGVPAAATNTDDFPLDFFNSQDPNDPNGRKRGILFLTGGTGLRLSDNNFVDINPGYAAEFSFFSPVRTFMPVGSNTVEVVFRVAGSGIPAIVNGFGVVFSDVDKSHSTTLYFYDSFGDLLAQASAPRRSDAGGLSFVGVVFPEAVVSLVRIVSGDAALGAGVDDRSAGGKQDLVIMDDFLFGEPQSDPNAPR